MSDADWKPFRLLGQIKLIWSPKTLLDRLKLSPVTVARILGERSRELHNAERHLKSQVEGQQHGRPCQYVKLPVVLDGESKMGGKEEGFINYQAPERDPSVSIYDGGAKVNDRYSREAEFWGMMAEAGVTDPSLSLGDLAGR